MNSRWLSETWSVRPNCRCKLAPLDLDAESREVHQFPCLTEWTSLRRPNELALLQQEAGSRPRESLLHSLCLAYKIAVFLVKKSMEGCTTDREFSLQGLKVISKNGECIALRVKSTLLRRKLADEEVEPSRSLADGRVELSTFVHNSLVSTLRLD